MNLSVVEATEAIFPNQAMNEHPNMKPKDISPSSLLINNHQTIDAKTVTNHLIQD
jgi:hypothetical protein